MKDSQWETEALQIDREDLLALLQIRFGEIPVDVRKEISDIHRTEVMQRLILVAANVPDWASFLKELQSGEAAFRLLGEDFNPLSKDTGRRTR